MPKSIPITLEKEFFRISKLDNRTPETTDEEAKDSFGALSDYENGGLFIAHFSGSSEWERHTAGDELVQVLGGMTYLILLEEKVECRHELTEGQLIIVPRGIWHRFESPGGVKLMTITPQPTDHSIEYPSRTC